MKTTDYKINGQEVSYEVTENGYMIYLGGKPWISQNEPYIPYPDLGYEESCLKQIEELVVQSEQPVKPTTEEKIAELEEQLEIQAQTITELAEIIGGAE